MKERKKDSEIYNVKYLELDLKNSGIRDFAFLPYDRLALLPWDGLQIYFINTRSGQCELIGKLARESYQIECLNHTLSLIERDGREVCVSLPALMKEPASQKEAKANQPQTVPVQT